jgi:hypothetical protein
VKDLFLVLRQNTRLRDRSVQLVHRLQTKDHIQHRFPSVSGHHARTCTSPRRMRPSTRSVRRTRTPTRRCFYEIAEVSVSRAAASRSRDRLRRAALLRRRLRKAFLNLCRPGTVPSWPPTPPLCSGGRWGSRGGLAAALCRSCQRARIRPRFHEVTSRLSRLRGRLAWDTAPRMGDADGATR